jgi:hypothetical protein
MLGRIAQGSAGDALHNRRGRQLFAAGAESVMLSRAEWEAIQEISEGYFANRLEV